jgi:hypothetical protein
LVNYEKVDLNIRLLLSVLLFYVLWAVVLLFCFLTGDFVDLLMMFFMVTESFFGEKFLGLRTGDFSTNLVVLWDI